MSKENKLTPKKRRLLARELAELIIADEFLRDDLFALLSLPNQHDEPFTDKTVALIETLRAYNRLILMEA